jgi:hypothetical protein
MPDANFVMLSATSARLHNHERVAQGGKFGSVILSVDNLISVMLDILDRFVCEMYVLKLLTAVKFT